MDSRTVRLLSLFSGVDGLGLGVRIALPNSREVCHVEREFSACEVLAARMADGSLNPAPIFTDITAFDGRPWRGRVDLIYGGSPCQDLSVAGKRAGIGGKRSGLWGEYRRVVEESRPAFVFFENVGGITSSLTLLHHGEIMGHLERLLSAAAVAGKEGDYRRRWHIERHHERLHRRLLKAYGIPALLYVQCGLEALGYRTQTGLFTASEVGASHKRERCFILAWDPVAYSEGRRLGILRESSQCDRQPDGSDEELGNHAGNNEWRKPKPSMHREGISPGGSSGRQLANAARHGGEYGADERAPWETSDSELADAELKSGSTKQLYNEGERPGGREEHRSVPGERSGRPLFAPGPSDPRWPDIISGYPWLSPAISEEDAKSYIRNVDDGLAAVLGGSRTDQLRACGNGVVATQAAYALVMLARRAGIE